MENLLQIIQSATQSCSSEKADHSEVTKSIPGDLEEELATRDDLPSVQGTTESTPINIEESATRDDTSEGVEPERPVPSTEDTGATESHNPEDSTPATPVPSEDSIDRKKKIALQKTKSHQKTIIQNLKVSKNPGQGYVFPKILLKTLAL